MSSEAGSNKASDTVSQVQYDHAGAHDLHTVTGALNALRLIFPKEMPHSLLDVGCGWGTWVRAAMDLGVSDVMAVDGADISQTNFLCPYELFRRQNLCESWDLERRFDVAVCVEVAEHLPPESAPILISSLVAHSDCVLFSAAAPRQPGQHHVNCQWPKYWQELFNHHGYACDDTPRWKIWEEGDIEPWYRQNLFLARRAPDRAGHEQRIRAVVHPDMLEGERHTYCSEIESGVLRTSWYFSLPQKAIAGKLKRKIQKAFSLESRTSSATMLRFARVEIAVGPSSSFAPPRVSRRLGKVPELG